VQIYCSHLTKVLLFIFSFCLIRPTGVKWYIDSQCWGGLLWWSDTYTFSDEEVCCGEVIHSQCWGGLLWWSDTYTFSVEEVCCGEVIRTHSVLKRSAVVKLYVDSFEEVCCGEILGSQSVLNSHVCQNCCVLKLSCGSLVSFVIGEYWDNLCNDFT